ncbi:hypothetical protein [Kribbella sp. DT2]|uniref:hypothetical protein n=1 Tax=Kribbella sp. DT2 TaxID=3393427 RepID=UPI003CEC8B93
MRFRLLSAALLTAATCVAAPLSAYAAPPRPAPEHLQTVGPNTACVRGDAHPYIADTAPRLQTFLPEDPNGPARASAQFRVVDVATGKRVFTGQSDLKLVGSWVETPGRQPQLENGKTYAWQARIFDGTEYSPWSRKCELTVDTDRPDAPGVTITPEGPYQVGQTVTLAFSPTSSTDVTAYGYGDRDTADVRIPSTPATAQYTFRDVGPTTITVWSYDRAGNPSSPPAKLNVDVAPTTPGTGLSAPTADQMATIDPTSSCATGDARPYLPGTNPRLRVLVPRVQDGPSVSVQFQMSELGTGEQVLDGQSPTKGTGSWFEPETTPALENGKTYEWHARVFDGTNYTAWSDSCELTVDTERPNAPGLTISPEAPYRVGQEVTLHFTNGGSTDLTSYSYGFFGAPTGTTPAGTPDVKLTLAEAGWLRLSAWSRDRAGLISDETATELTVTQQ